jgi:hypothetical protein
VSITLSDCGWSAAHARYPPNLYWLLTRVLSPPPPRCGASPARIARSWRSWPGRRYQCTSPGCVFPCADRAETTGRRPVILRSPDSTSAGAEHRAGRPGRDRGPAMNTHTEPGVLHAVRGPSGAIDIHADSAGSRITSARQAALVTLGYPEVVISPRKLRYRTGAAGPSQGLLRAPQKPHKSVRDTVPDPHRNPTDETAHSGTLVTRVKGTQNSRSAASMRVSWADGVFSW